MLQLLFTADNAMTNDDAVLSHCLPLNSFNRYNVNASSNEISLLSKIKPFDLIWKGRYSTLRLYFLYAPVVGSASYNMACIAPSTSVQIYV